MRVAHFVQRYPPALGGSEAYFARLSRYLADAGDHVRVVTSNALDLEAFWSPRGRVVASGTADEDGVEVRRHALWRCRGRRYLLKPLSLVPHRLWQCLTMPCNPIAPGMWSDAGRGVPAVDVVHATAFPYAWPIACGLRLARRLGVPFLLTPFLHLGNVENSRDRTRRAYLSPALLTLARAADRVFVQTGRERGALLDHGIPAERLVSQGMGVSIDECTGGNRERARRQWHLGPDDVVIGHLANNSIEKGTVDLLHAAERAWQRGHRFVLALAGPEMPNFRRFCQTYGPASRVRRLGVLSEEEKRDFFAGLDVFALPSRSDSFGLVLLEAWANRLPNVAYRAGGPAEVVRDGQDGVLVRCGDVDRLAESLGRLAADPGLRRHLGEQGRRRVELEFRWAERLELVRQVYQEVTGEQSMAPRSPVRLFQAHG
jgi:glycosyltransferase involved in cell wall biosynthesis